jgi:hypothetical protein
MAAQMSWERAASVADALPADHPDRLALRIRPRTLLCSNAFRRFHPDLSGRFEELRELCMEAGDKASLAIGMAGLAMEHMLQGRVSDASRQASEHMTLVESVGDETLTLALTIPACTAKLQAAEMADVLGWAQAAIDIADGDATRGNFMLGSPLAMALVYRGFARCSMGLDGWRKDLDDGVAMARTADPATFAVAAAYKYVNISRLVLSADEAAMAEIIEAFEVAQRCSEDLPVVLLRMIFGTVLTYGEDRARGLAMLTELRDTCAEERYAMNIISGLDTILARHAAAADIDSAIERARAAVEELFTMGNFINCEMSTHAFVELLMARGTHNDLKDAEVVIERLAATLADSEWVTRDIVLLRTRAMLAKARGDDASYREFRDRYRAMADQFGFEGHMALAAAMP